MSALTQARMPIETTWKKIALPLASSTKAYQGGIACLDTSDYTVKPAVAGSTTLVKVGEFEESVDNSGGGSTTPILVNLDREIVVRWYDNATGGAAVANLFTTAYLLDDHTVTNSSTGNSAAGRVWAVDSVKGVAIQATSL